MSHPKWITRASQLPKPFIPGWYGQERCDDWKPVEQTRWICHYQTADMIELLLEDGQLRVFGPIEWPPETDNEHRLEGSRAGDS